MAIKMKVSRAPSKCKFCDQKKAAREIQKRSLQWFLRAAIDGGGSPRYLKMGRPRIHPEKAVTRGRPFQEFARKRALDVTQKYAARWGRKRCKSGRIIKPRVDPRISWPRIQDFQSRFRLPQECVEELTEEFERSPFRPGKGKHENRGSPIPLFHKVCYALRYMATGSYYAVLRDTQGGCSRSSVGRAVMAFTKFLCSKAKHHIRFPQGEALHESAIRFSNRYKMNQCVGCIDGTHIPIRRPQRNPHAFINRKGFYSLNALVVTDHEERFTYVESGLSGAHHDMAVFRYSDFGQKISNTDRLGNYFLLGDAGYALTPQVMTPFRCTLPTDLTEAQQKYQKAHVHARNSVERAIGQLKCRWRCLSKTGVGAIEMSPLHASWLVKACVVLHNRCIDWGLRKLTRGQSRDPDYEMNIQVRAHMRFTRYNRELREQAEVQAEETYGPTYAGIAKRAQYIFKNYGGPAPAGGVRGRARRRGRGRGNPAVERAGASREGGLVARGGGVQRVGRRSARQHRAER